MTAPRSIELYKRSLAATDKVVEVVRGKRGNERGRHFHLATGTDFLVHPLDDGIGSTSTLVVLGESGALGEKLDSRVSLNAELGGQRLSGSGIHIGNLHITISDCIIKIIQIIVNIQLPTRK